MGDSMMQRFVSRGYGWYLAAKIIKAMLSPFALVVYLATAVAGLLILPALAACRELRDCVASIPDFFREFMGRHWLDGFSRARYNSLYRKPDVIVYRLPEPHQ